MNLQRASTHRIWLLREAVKAARGTQLARDDWALAYRNGGPRRTYWQLIVVFEAHKRAVVSHNRTIERKKKAAAA